MHSWKKCAAVLFVVASCAQARASVVTTSGALVSQGSIGLGSNVTVVGTIEANGSISAGANSRLSGMMAICDISLDQHAFVSGSVISNATAYAGQGLQLRGDWVGKTVSLDQKADISGNVWSDRGGIDIGQQAMIGGSVLSNGNVWIDKNSTIAGDARAGLGRTLSTGKNVSIGGSTAQGSFNVPMFSGVDETRFDAPAHGSASGNSLWVGNSQSLSLQAGSHGSLSAGNQAQVDLASGSYTLASLWMGNGGVLNVDTTGGDVVLDVLGDFSVGENFSVNLIGDGRLRLNVMEGGDVWLGNNAVMSALVTVFSGRFDTGNNVQLSGQFAASKGIWIGNNSSVSMVDPTAVPEPTVLAILLAGGVLLPRRRQKVSMK